MLAWYPYPFLVFDFALLWAANGTGLFLGQIYTTPKSKHLVLFP
jgi:hypothetical protein